MSFARASATQRIEPGISQAEILPDWDIAGRANGGYLMALAARAMGVEAGKPDPATITAHFLRPGEPGPIEVHSTVLKQGRQLATTSATVLKQGRPLMALMASFTDLPASKAASHTIELLDRGPLELPPPDECCSTTENGPALMRQIDLRIHPEDHFVAQKSGKALMRGWFRWPNDEPLDIYSLLVACDAFPPTIFNLDLPVAWVPTIELTVHLRAKPAPGWLRCEFQTRFISGGFLEEDGLIWDSNDRLVAQSRQLALLPKAR